MRVTRFDWDGADPAELAARIRALQPQIGEVSQEVAQIIDEVRRDGDAALLRLEELFGGSPPVTLRVPADQIASAADAAGEITAALRVAAANIREVAESEAMGERETEAEAPSGQIVRTRPVPVGAAGAYVPGGEASYPSTALMCCIPARAAGVERIAVVSPIGPNGDPNPLVLAACSVAEVDEVYAVGGVQAIAALALGTETIEPVDVIVGPGNRYVQEAKRQLYGHVGIDGIAGPSELMAVVGPEVELGWIALDLCAQAEHGNDGLLVAASTDAARLEALEAEVERVAKQPGSEVGDAPLALVTAPSDEAAVELANALAPEHLELACEHAFELANHVRTAGCVFTGSLGATALGDFAAGSNHVLPTGGAGRFMGPLGPRAFRRRVPIVRIPQEAARELGPTVATLARAEGFPLHAESAEVRAEEVRAEDRGKTR
jgi:histidinol dehydrogenase